MEIIFKRYLLILFFILMSHQVVKADESAGQEHLFLSQTQSVLLEDLDNERGRGGVDVTTLNNSYVGATMRDSSATNNTSGSNYIDSGSFAGASGLTSVIQNTGNNVIIQNSTTVNVTIIP